jgi:hypothetical protein
MIYYFMWLKEYKDKKEILSTSAQIKYTIVAFYLEYYRIIDLYLYHWEGIAKKYDYHLSSNA